MPLETERTSRTFTGVHEGSVLECDFPCYDTTSLEVYYGEGSLRAVLDSDFSVELNKEGSYADFKVEVLAPLAASIEALVSEDPERETNYVTVRRRLPLLTDVSPAIVRDPGYLAAELTRIHLKLQQLASTQQRAFSLPPKFADGSVSVELQASPSEGYALMWDAEGQIVNSDFELSVLKAALFEVSQHLASIDDLAPLTDEIESLGALLTEIGSLYALRVDIAKLAADPPELPEISQLTDGDDETKTVSEAALGALNAELSAYETAAETAGDIPASDLAPFRAAAGGGWKFFSKAKLLKYLGFSWQTGTIGFLRVPGGITVQWGSYNSANDAPVAYSLATSYDTACWGVWVSGSTTSGSTASTTSGFAVSSFTTSTVTIDRDDGVNGAATIYIWSIGH